MLEFMEAREEVVHCVCNDLLTKFLSNYKADSFSPAHSDLCKEKAAFE